MSEKPARAIVFNVGAALTLLAMGLTFTEVGDVVLMVLGAIGMTMMVSAEIFICDVLTKIDALEANLIQLGFLIITLFVARETCGTWFELCRAITLAHVTAFTVFGAARVLGRKREVRVTAPMAIVGALQLVIAVVVLGSTC